MKRWLLAAIVLGTLLANVPTSTAQSFTISGTMEIFLGPKLIMLAEPPTDAADTLQAIAGSTYCQGATALKYAGYVVQEGFKIIGEVNLTLYVGAQGAAVMGGHQAQVTKNGAGVGTVVYHNPTGVGTACGQTRLFQSGTITKAQWNLNITGTEFVPGDVLGLNLRTWATPSDTVAYIVYSTAHPSSIKFDYQITSRFLTNSVRYVMPRLADTVPASGTANFPVRFVNSGPEPVLVDTNVQGLPAEWRWWTAPEVVEGRLEIPANATRDVDLFVQPTTPEPAKQFMVTLGVEGGRTLSQNLTITVLGLGSDSSSRPTDEGVVLPPASGAPAAQPVSGGKSPTFGTWLVILVVASIALARRRA